MRRDNPPGATDATGATGATGATDARDAAGRANSHVRFTIIVFKQSYIRYSYGTLLTSVLQFRIKMFAFIFFQVFVRFLSVFREAVMFFSFFNLSITSV